MPTSVKYFHSGMAGAPTLNNAAGSLINVLDACLVDGFGLKSVDSLVVAANVATVTVSAGLAGYEADQVVLVAGAGISALNGEKRLLSVTATTVTFAAQGVSDQTVSGTITLKAAPAGWAKAYAATNIAAYRSADVLGTRMYLRVDDGATSVNVARVQGFEAMTDASTGTGPFPTSAQFAGGMAWPKVDASSATARKWLVVADGRTLYLCINSAAAPSWQYGGNLASFGDFASNKSGDAYACLLSGSNTDCATSSGTDTTMSMGYSRKSAAVVPGMYLARSLTGVGTSIQAGRRAQSYIVSDVHSGASNEAGTYPNVADNSLLMTPVLVLEASPAAVRGHLRGLYHVAQDVRAAMPHMTRVDGQGALSGRRLLVVQGYGYAAPAAAQGVSLIDLTGPWA